MARADLPKQIVEIAPPRRPKPAPGLGPVRFPRASIVGPHLDALLTRLDRRARLDHDPLGLVHRYADPLDREWVGMLASAVAYGRVDLFRPRLSALLESLGPSPSAWARDASPSEVLRGFADFSYRMTGPSELAALAWATARVQRDFGSVGQLAARCLAASEGRWREALDRLVATIWSADLTPFIGQCEPNRRLSHLLSSPAGASACKRLNLYCRWMVRGPDGVDFGQWPVSASVLVMPLDTHVHRIAGFLGLTRRSDLSWRTAEEVTARLRLLDPADPVKYDFALSHLGISGECPSRRDADKCGRCPLRPVCRLWDAPRSARTPSK